MPRYWSEQDGCFVDCEVTHAGRGAMPHELKNRHLWRTKQTITDFAGERTGKRYSRLKNCTCGRVIRGSGHRKCWTCRKSDTDARTELRVGNG
jgi:hypothetical protein